MEKTGKEQVGGKEDSKKAHWPQQVRKEPPRFAKTTTVSTLLVAFALGFSGCTVDADDDGSDEMVADDVAQQSLAMETPPNPNKVLMLNVTKGGQSCQPGALAFWKLKYHIRKCSKGDIQLESVGTINYPTQAANSDALWYEIKDKIKNDSSFRARAHTFLYCYPSTITGDGTNWGGHDMMMMTRGCKQSGDYLAHEFLHTLGLGGTPSGLMGDGAANSCPTGLSVTRDGWPSNYPKTIKLPDGYNNDNW